MSKDIEELKQLQKKNIEAMELSAKTLAENGERIESYRVSIGPSLISVAGKIETAADKQVKAAELNASSIKDVVERMDRQEERHRAELKEERKRQDKRDERHFSAVESLSAEVKEFSRISLENAQQVSTLTDAVALQCERSTKLGDDLNKIKIDVAVAKSKWAIIGVAAGVIGSGLVGFMLKAWGGK